MIYDPLTSEESSKTNGVMLNGHTDFNSISTLVSQPVTALQVLMPDNVWRYVKHKDGALVINIGDQLSFMSGGILKGTMHRGMFLLESTMRLATLTIGCSNSRETAIGPDTLPPTRGIPLCAFHLRCSFGSPSVEEGARGGARHLPRDNTHH